MPYGLPASLQCPVVSLVSLPPLTEGGEVVEDYRTRKMFSCCHSSRYLHHHWRSKEIIMPLNVSNSEADAWTRKFARIAGVGLTDVKSGMMTSLF